MTFTIESLPMKNLQHNKNTKKKLLRPSEKLKEEKMITVASDNEKRSSGLYL